MAKVGDNRTQRDQIERIVREVLAELMQKQASKTSTGKELIVSEKVISAAQLEKRLGGIERLIVPRGAVFTPAARDLLKEKHIAVDTDHEPKSLTNWTANAGISLERLPQTRLSAAIDGLCQRVTGSNALGIIITHNTAAALCLANRHHGIRAALATGIDAVTEAIASVASNVLIVDPTGKSSFEWQRLLQTWIDTNRPELPATLRERLG
jgi:hypothetical protein